MLDSQEIVKRLKELDDVIRHLQKYNANTERNKGRYEGQLDMIDYVLDMLPELK